MLLFSCWVVSDTSWPHSWQRSTPGFPVLHHLPEFAQTHVHWVDDVIQHLILCHPLLLPSVFPSIRLFFVCLFVFFPMSQLFASGGQILELQLQHQSFQWIFRLISFRSDWFDLLASQGTLKSLLQLHSSKASILQLSVFFKVQLISVHDYWKNHSFD